MARTMADAFNQYHQGYVKPQVESKVGKNSPAFTGTPTAPTADNDTDSEQIATTEFCQNLIRRLCGVDTKTIALLADLADALLNQPDFRDAVVTVLGNKLDKTAAATTYATKAELNNVTVNDSNYAKLNAANTFTQDQTINGLIKMGENKDNGYFEINRDKKGVGLEFKVNGGSSIIALLPHEIELIINKKDGSGNVGYYLKEDGIYKGSTKIV